MQQLINKQIAKVICRFDRLDNTQQESKRLISDGNISAAHTFNYIVFRINPALTSCEDLAMVVDNIVWTIISAYNSS